MIIIFGIICLLASIIMILDATGLGLFGKTAKNFYIAGVVDSSESRKVSFLCAQVLNEEIDAALCINDREHFIVFKDKENTPINVTDPLDKTFGNRMLRNYNFQTNFREIAEPFGAVNISYQAKEDLMKVIRWCLEQDKIEKERYTRNSGWFYDY